MDVTRKKRSWSDDEGVSNILGFIAGLVLLTGSMATAAYFMTTAPKTASDQSNRALESQTLRIVNTLATSPGDPPDWHKRPLSELKTPGLLAQGGQAASLDKIQEIQDGNLTATRMIEAFNLQSAGYSVDATGRIVPVPVARAPESRTFVVANATSLAEDPDGIGSEPLQYQVEISEESRRGIKLYKNSSPGFDWQIHNWSSATASPERATGNVHPDDPWFMEANLIPQMAGIEGTFTYLDHSDSTTHSEASVEAMREYHQGNNEFPRWHVVTHEEPFAIPSNPNESIKEHVLMAGYRKTAGNSNNASGVGLWRSTDGVHTFALLGGWDVTNLDDLELKFDHVLRVNHDEENSQLPECHTINGTENCVRIRPSIYYWDNVDDHWDRIQNNTDACPGSNWNHTGDAEATTSWTRKVVDLCQAEQRAQGELWLTLGWITDCLGSDGSDADEIGEEQDCGDAKHRTRGWYVDNIQVTSNTKTVFETGFDPLSQVERATLFTSLGVDFANYKLAPDDIEENTWAYLRHFVKAGGNIVAYTPGVEGNWLGQMGLDAIDRPRSRNVVTVDVNNIMMRMPNELPANHSAFAAADVGWNLSDPPDRPSGLGTSGFTALNQVQVTFDHDSSKVHDQMGTLLYGQPYKKGGHVSAVAYNLTEFNDTELRNDLLENLYISSQFKDPTFDLAGAEPPESGSVPVHALRRVVLVSVTEDEQYQVPLEITLYVWPQRVGD